MTKFNKGFKASIILIIAVSFLVTETVYAAAIPKRQSLRKPLITAEQKNRNRLASTAALLKLRRDLTDGRYLAERFDNYATTIRSAVNPDLDTYVIAVGGTGPNISAPLLDTFFTKAYFIDVIEFSVDKLKKWHEPFNWQLYEATSKNAYFTYKRLVGWIDTNTFEKNPEERLIMELKAMGVNREDVKIDVDDKGRPVVEFKLPGDNTTRKIVFIHQDLLNLDEELHSELKGELEAYHQKGVLSVTNSYGKYLSSISEWIKPEGFLILNNYDKDEQFEDPEPYINNKFVHYSRKLESLSLGLKYGWKMSLYRKMPLSTGLSDITGETLSNKILSFFPDSFPDSLYEPKRIRELFKKAEEAAKGTSYEADFEELLANIAKTIDDALDLDAGNLDEESELIKEADKICQSLPSEGIILIKDALGEEDAFGNLVMNMMFGFQTFLSFAEPTPEKFYSKEKKEKNYEIIRASVFEVIVLLRAYNMLREAKNQSIVFPNRKEIGTSS